MARTMIITVSSDIPGYLWGHPLSYWFPGLSVTHSCGGTKQKIWLIEHNGATIDSVLDKDLRNKLLRRGAVIEEDKKQKKE